MPAAMTTSGQPSLECQGLECQAQSEPDNAMTVRIHGLHESSSAGVVRRAPSPTIIRSAPFVSRPVPGGVIEDVEPLRPELQVKALGQLEVAEQARIQVGVLWAVQGDVPPRGAEAVLPLYPVRVRDERHNCEGRRVVPITIRVWPQAA